MCNKIVKILVFDYFFFVSADNVGFEREVVLLPLLIVMN